MITTKDKIWLDRVLRECFSGKDDKNGEERLKGFGMLVRAMTKNIEKEFYEIQALLEKGSKREELRERFGLLERNLFYSRL